MLEQQREGAERLGGLAGREGEAAHAAVCREQAAHRFAVQRLDVAVGHHAEAAAARDAFERGGEDALPDMDVIGA